MGRIWPLTLRSAFLLTVALTGLCFLLLAGGALWAYSSSRALAARAEMAREQALLVTRLEADLAHRGRAGTANQAGMDAQLKETIAAYLRTIDDERPLIADDDGAQDYQAREAREARDLAGLLSAGDDPASIERARLLSRAIAAREGKEAGEAARLANGLLSRLWLMIGLSAVVLLGCYGSAMFLLWRGVIRPVEALAGAADRVAAEMSPTRVEPRGPAEVRGLISRFNHMAQAVEQQVSQRTEELESANAALREIDARRRLFFSKVSHELRTPVTVIRGEAELALRQRGDVEALRGAMQHLLDSSIFLQRRLDDLLALARAEDGALAISLERTDLTAIVRHAAATAESFAAASEVRLSAAAGDRPLFVMGDAERLVQALVAIIDNGVKFTPPGGVVHIAMAEQAGQAIIAVRDDGPGVEDVHLSAIFEPYARVANGRGQGGAGLGLAIARWIASAHGGDIKAANDGMGEGLCITISLPVAA